jgi:hypothetical protein
MLALLGIVRRSSRKELNVSSPGVLVLLDNGVKLSHYQWPIMIRGLLTRPLQWAALEYPVIRQGLTDLARALCNVGSPSFGRM